MRVIFTVNGTNLKAFEQKNAIIEAGDQKDNLQAFEAYINWYTGEIKSLENWKNFLPSHENYENFCKDKLRPVQLKDPYTWECQKADDQEQMDRINSFLVQYNNAAKDL